MSIIKIDSTYLNQNGSHSTNLRWMEEYLLMQDAEILIIFVTRTIKALLISDS
jgi:hypothetical protein